MDQDLLILGESRPPVDTVPARTRRRGETFIPAWDLIGRFRCTWALRGHAVLYVVYNAMRFEWDAEKNRSNQKKHSGVDFETASRVFADPDLMLRKDRVIDGEQRWHALGGVRKAVLLVVHVYLEEKPNGEEAIRIISAREANPRERRVYLEQTTE